MNKHYMQASAGMIIPGYNGPVLFGEKDPGDYVGKHRFYNDHDRIGQNGVIWLGCRLCCKAIGLSYPAASVPSGRDRYWNEPAL